MPLSLEIKKKLHTHTERVKSVDFHPTEQWVLSGLYSGVIVIHDYTTQTVLKSVEISTLPIRTARFIAKKQWVVAGGDDMLLRVYNYNTLEKVKEIEAHSDYIRCTAVHPTLSYLLSAGDDMTVKLWDWERDFCRVASFEGHAHYIMMVAWNPKDPHLFASASLDRSIKVWGVPTGIAAGLVMVDTPHYALLGHERGVNCIEYSPSGDRPYLLSGSDDKTVRVWDYQTKQCLQVLSGHSKNVTAVCFHPHLPLIFSGAEDGTIRLWHSSTYRQETSLSYGMERVWGFTVRRGRNAVGVAFDEGTLVLSVGSEAPIASMQGAKVVWNKASEIQTANLKLIDHSLVKDGEILQLSVKDMGAVELFPQSISHHPSGRFIAVIGDGEYVIYTSQALRNKSFGRALSLVWSPEGHYATRNEGGQVTIFHSFVEHFSFKPSFPLEEIFGGKLLGVRSPDFVCFYDWDECRLIRRVDVCPRDVWWSAAGDLVCLACQDSFFLLRHDKNAVAAAVTAGVADADEGIEIAFDLIQEVPERLETGMFVSDSFLYLTAGLRLQSVCAGQVETLAFLERPMVIIGYVEEENRVFLIDRDLNVVSYQIHISLINYQVAISRKDWPLAAQHFAQIPEEFHTRVAKFLETQGHMDQALNVTKDYDHKFDLALQLKKFKLCSELLLGGSLSDSVSPSAMAVRWKQLGDSACHAGSFDLAAAAYEAAGDVASLLLLYSSQGAKDKLEALVQLARDKKQFNAAFIAALLTHQLDTCIQVLLESNRLPEAAFFARSYAPSRLPEMVRLWKKDLRGVNALVAEAVADPSEYPEQFPDLQLALQAEESFRRVDSVAFPPSSRYQEVRDGMPKDAIAAIKELGQQRFESSLAAQISGSSLCAAPRDLLDDGPPSALGGAADASPAATAGEISARVSVSEDLLGGFDDATDKLAAEPEEDQDRPAAPAKEPGLSLLDAYDPSCDPLLDE
eukprot:GHVT01062852.1.p1 GENE.GHVT01062852.1~~GHVT01062852.1.p1  ORF type:complete len:966 (-),score=220.35 GHVT01062852.1:995-3892(-)